MRKKQPVFTPFGWALAIFCLPVILWPMSLLFSAVVGQVNTLSSVEIKAFAIFYWIYPLILLPLAGIINVIYRSSPKLAKGALVFSFFGFYSLSSWIIIQTFL